MPMTRPAMAPADKSPDAGSAWPSCDGDAVAPVPEEADLVTEELAVEDEGPEAGVCPELPGKTVVWRVTVTTEELGIVRVVPESDLVLAMGRPSGEEPGTGLCDMRPS